jgi:hypothetical protein
MEQHGRSRQHEQGGEEVDHHQVRVELGIDDDPADDRLGEHAEDEAAGQPHEVPAERTASDRREERRGDHDDEHDRDHPVAELDERVEPQRRRQLALRAARPIRAAETRSGQPHRGAGEDDGGDADEGHERQPANRLRGDRGHAAQPAAGGHGSLGHATVW